LYFFLLFLIFVCIFLFVIGCTNLCDCCYGNIVWSVIITKLVIFVSICLSFCMIWHSVHAWLKRKWSNILKNIYQTLPRRPTLQDINWRVVLWQIENKFFFFLPSSILLTDSRQMFTTWPFVASWGNLKWFPKWSPSQGIYAGDVRNFNGHSIA
jgi:hypothetical protein